MIFQVISGQKIKLMPKFTSKMFHKILQTCRGFAQNK